MTCSMGLGGRVVAAGAVVNRDIGGVPVKVIGIGPGSDVQS